MPRSDNTKPTARFDPRKLAKATAERDPGDDLDDAFREWEQAAHGTPAAESVEIPEDGSSDRLGPRSFYGDRRFAPLGHPTPNVSRTATVHDPLTTGLLAEVTRRPEVVTAADDDPPPFEVLVPERPTRRIPQQPKAPRVTPNVIKRKRR